ncbi:MAG: PilX N-terminal domain-containing pilus assembly protein, partial [Burkholderiales bacterium]
MNSTHLAAHGQRGAAALIVTLALFFAMVLVAVFANRNLVFEQRTSANQYRSTQAFEAAEAGLEWALAQLNANQRIGADCLPSAEPAASSFRARYLSVARLTGALTPRSWNAAGTPTPLLPSCVRAGNGWSCSCPASGLPNLTAPAGEAPAAAFSLEFFATGKPGVVRVVANGCTQLAGTCLAGSTSRPDASAKIEVAFGLVAGLRTLPAATVTTRAGFDAGSAAIGLHNPDPATGIAVNAGGAINAAAARLTPPAGAPKTGLLVGNDAALVALDNDRFFAAHFGVDKAAWKAQPAVTRISCTTDCASVLGAALAAAADSALIHVEGDLVLAGPLTLGSAERPVVIVVSGAAQLDGAVALHGVLYAGSLNWSATNGGAFVRGALLSEAGYQGSG